MVRSHPRERTAAADRKSGRGAARHDDLPRSGHHQANQQTHESPGVAPPSPRLWWRAAGAAPGGGGCGPPPRRGSSGQPARGRRYFSTPGANMSLPEQVHYLLIRHVVETGHAPELTTLASLAKLSPQETEHALRQLSEMHGVVLVPSWLQVWSPHPL